MTCVEQSSVSIGKGSSRNAECWSRIKLGQTVTFTTEVLLVLDVVLSSFLLSSPPEYISYRTVRSILLFRNVSNALHDEGVITPASETQQRSMLFSLRGRRHNYT